MPKKDEIKGTLSIVYMNKHTRTIPNMPMSALNKFKNMEHIASHSDGTYTLYMLDGIIELVRFTPNKR